MKEEAVWKELGAGLTEDESEKEKLPLRKEGDVGDLAMK